MGNKASEQSAGFLRILDAPNPLDRTAVHPESYYIVEKMAADMGVDIETLIADKQLQTQINIEKYIDENTGPETLRDISTR